MNAGNKRLATMALAAMALGLSGGHHAGMRVRAAPLDAATCERLKGEQAALEAAGARANLALGPTAAKATLAADKLAQVKALIDLDAQLAFRCPHAKPLVQLKEEPVVEAAKPAKDTAKAKPKPKPKAPAAKPLETGAIGDAAPVTAAKAPPVAKRAASKPKPNDAFQPPASSSPFQRP